MASVDYDLPEGAKWSLLDREYYETVTLSERYRGAGVPSSSIPCVECDGTGRIRRNRETLHGRQTEDVQPCEECDGMGSLEDPGGWLRHCWNCNTFTPHRTPPTRSKQDAVDAACCISVSLHEYRVDHDWLQLVATVKALKSKPSRAGDDYGVFQEAVATAIRSARSLD